MKWNLNRDVANNCKVDGSSITMIAKHYGEFDP
jgi:hypothetical protein